MPQSLKTIKNRINSIENVHKVTQAMQMIAVAKFNRAQRTNNSIKSYFSRMQTIAQRVLAASADTPNIFCKEKTAQEGICLCIITADAGLCGMYNFNLLRLAEEFIARRKEKNINLVILGKKGWHHFQRNHKLMITGSYLGSQGKYSQEVCADLYNLLSTRFLNPHSEQVYIAYTHYENATSLQPMIEKFLPLECLKSENNPVKYLHEPRIGEITSNFIPRFLFLKLKSILLDSFTCEHASRTVAMKKSAENAKELLGSLVMLRNKTRQAAITQEMLEIISSAEALKG